MQSQRGGRVLRSRVAGGEALYSAALSPLAAPPRSPLPGGWKSQPPSSIGRSALNAFLCFSWRASARPGTLRSALQRRGPRSALVTLFISSPLQRKTLRKVQFPRIHQSIFGGGGGEGAVTRHYPATPRAPDETRMKRAGPRLSAGSQISSFKQTQKWSAVGKQRINNMSPRGEGSLTLRVKEHIRARSRVDALSRTPSWLRRKKRKKKYIP